MRMIIKYIYIHMYIYIYIYNRRAHIFKYTYKQKKCFILKLKIINLYNKIINMRVIIMS